MAAKAIRPGHKRWFQVNCSLMLYEWTGQDWVFTGTAKRFDVREGK